MVLSLHKPTQNQLFCQHNQTLSSQSLQYREKSSTTEVEVYMVTIGLILSLYLIVMAI